jgi:elongation factor Ts
MISLDIDKIKELRELTGAGIQECQKALETARGNKKEALAVLKIKGGEVAKKKKDRVTTAGLIECYVHAGGKVASMVELLCETDFVAQNEEFKKLAHEIAMQIAAMNPRGLKELLCQPYIRDETKTVDDLVKELIGKTRENIKINRFQRFEMGIDNCRGGTHQS